MSKDLSQSADILPEKTSNKGTWLANGSTGSIMVYLAFHLPDDLWCKESLIYVSPFVGAGLLILWRWLMRRLDQWLKIRTLKKRFVQANRFVEKSLKISTISESRRFELQLLSDEINRMEAKLHIGLVSAVELEKLFETPFEPLIDIEPVGKTAKLKGPR